MRYDGESGRIIIGYRELVAIARRRFSPTSPIDEDEPSVSVGRSESRERIYYGFESGGYSFELYADEPRYEEGGIRITRRIRSSPKKPKKEEAAQIRGEGYITAFIISALSSGEAVKILFTYVNDLTGESADSEETVSYAKLESFFKRCVGAIGIYALPEIERVTERMPSLAKMKFPYDKVREGQREFISAAYRALARGGRLYAGAPTGTGKTVSALFPALRAIGNLKCEKVFYLTPKTTTAEAARECLELMAERGAKIRAIVLASKDRSCRRGRVCKESYSLCECSSCNMIAEAAMELYSLQKTVVTLKEVLPVSQKYKVCPYELSLTYSELCDVVICDFNYLFDPSVYIRRFFEAGGNYAFLIDEAHNLSERVREEYSIEITARDILSPTECELLGPLSATRRVSENAEKVFRATLLPLIKEEIRETGDGKRVGATHLSEVPLRLYTLFSELIVTVEGELSASLGAKDEERDGRVSFLREYYYRLRKLDYILTSFDDSYEMLLFYEDGELKMKLYCLDTGPVIRKRLSLGHGAVLFSATLSPLGYYKQILGGERSDASLEVSSPFDPSQLSVSIMDKISTRSSERERTLGAVVRVIAAAISARRGNYMVFSPSFAYSEALARAFREKYPKLQVILQTPDMTAKEKAGFLEKFKEQSSSYLVAFCVMGGIYSEGIDLAGDSLIGAIIVGVGIPSLSYEREAIAAYYEEKFEEGKQYAYIYPGMNKVFQAAGRVIRREDDKGIIVLIDDRFDDPIYKKSLPKLWEGVKFLGDARELRCELDEFWRDEK